MVRDDYNFLLTLEEIMYRKKNGKTKGLIFTLKNKFPIEKSSSTFLSNSPEYKNKFLMDLAKDYINRKKINK